MQRLQTRSLPHIFTTPPSGHVPPARLRWRLGVALEVSAQTFTPRLGALPFARATLTTEAAPTRDDAPDVQPPVGFAPYRRGWDRFHLVAAAESHC